MNQSAMLARFVERDLVDCVLLAGRYSLLDQSGARATCCRCAARRGVAVIAGGVFNSGLLADPRPGATLRLLRRPRRRWSSAPQRLGRVCARYDVPLRAAALQFPTFHPAVATVLVGARSAAEIADNARLFALDIPPALWRALRDEGGIDRDRANPWVAQRILPLASGAAARAKSRSTGQSPVPPPIGGTGSVRCEFQPTSYVQRTAPRRSRRQARPRRLGPHYPEPEGQGPSPQVSSLRFRRLRLPIGPTLLSCRPDARSSGVQWPFSTR